MDLEINVDFTPAQKGEKVLRTGDSITQGCGPLRSSHTYVSAATALARRLCWNASAAT